MAKNLPIGEKKSSPANPVCQAAEQCCWYETPREFSSECSHRNELICHLRREEVFGESELAKEKLQEDALAPA